MIKLLSQYNVPCKQKYQTYQKSKKVYGSSWLLKKLCTWLNRAKKKIIMVYDSVVAHPALWFGTNTFCLCGDKSKLSN